MLLKHKKTTVPHPEFGPIKVDQEIAELIERLWQLNIWTLNSCQENKPGTIWIEFESSTDVELFLNTVFSFLSEENKELLGLYERIYLDPDNSWIFSTTYTNLKEDEENYDVINDFRFSISLRFPISDYPAVLKAITEFIDANIAQERANCFSNQSNQL